MSAMNKPNKAELAQIWATLAQNSGPDPTPCSGPRTLKYDGTWAVFSCLPNLGHKQAIVRQYESHENKYINKAELAQIWANLF